MTTTARPAPHRSPLAVRVVAAVATCLGVFSLAGVATAAPGLPVGDWREQTVTVAASPAPGPASTQVLHVLQVGPRSAATVLVLVAGRGEAAGGFRTDAEAIARSTPGVQVWAVDRREEDLADKGGFALPPDLAADHYLDGGHVTLTAADAPWAADWGLAVELADVRTVVLAARDHGRRQVVLGGHSLGATAVLDYAAWDFDGSPGYRDLAGMMLLDGGVRGALAGAGIDFSLDAAGARTWSDQIAGGAVFDTATSSINGFGDATDAAAVDYGLAARYALADPHGASGLADRLPVALRPDRPVTNAGLLGWLVDEHALLPGYAVTSGRLTTDGDWEDTGPTHLATVARAYAGQDPAAWEQYSPNRLALDYFGSSAFAQDDVADLLGLRLTHTTEIDVPLYVVESGLTHGTVGTSAQEVAATTRIPRVEVHRDDSLTHLDLLFDTVDNPFVATAGPFLRSVARGCAAAG